MRLRTPTLRLCGKRGGGVGGRPLPGKAAWVGRSASVVFGLALVLALVFGAATAALGANGGNLVLGSLNNAATAVTRLAGDVDGPAVQVANPNPGADDTALDLRVQAGEAPLRVNSGARVANLNAARAGRADSAASADTANSARNADTLDGKDSAQFADSSHAHSGADISSGTVEADRVEDGAGSDLNADQLDGKDSVAYQPRVKWARVFADGSYSGSRGVVSVTRRNPGIYEVEFDEDVAHTCSIIGSLNSGSAPGFVKAGSGGVGTPNDTVLVTTQNRDFTHVDNHFYVTVLC